MATDFDPAEIDVIEDDYTSNLSYDESENASTLRILGLCEYARGLQHAGDELARTAQRLLVASIGYRGTNQMTPEQAALFEAVSGWQKSSK
jgi:hypothetical protein